MKEKMETVIKISKKSAKIAKIITKIKKINKTSSIITQETAKKMMKVGITKKISKTKIRKVIKAEMINKRIKTRKSINPVHKAYQANKKSVIMKMKILSFQIIWYGNHLRQFIKSNIWRKDPKKY